MSVFQALSAGNGINPFKSAPRPVFIPPHVPLCARLSFERNEKALITAAINKINAMLRNRGGTNALFRFVVTKKIRIIRRSTVFISKHMSVSSAIARHRHLADRRLAGNQIHAMDMRLRCSGKSDRFGFGGIYRQGRHHFGVCEQIRNESPPSHGLVPIQSVFGNLTALPHFLQLRFFIRPASLAPHVHVNVHVVPFFLGKTVKQSIVGFGFRNWFGRPNL